MYNILLFKIEFINFIVLLLKCSICYNMLKRPMIGTKLQIDSNGRSAHCKGDDNDDE